jgi:hypothetical protein
MVVRNERQPQDACGAGALATAASEQPEFDRRTLSRSRRKVHPVVRFELSSEQGDDVVELVIEIRHLNTRLLKDRTRRSEPLRQDQRGQSEGLGK